MPRKKNPLPPQHISDIVVTRIAKEFNFDKTLLYRHNSVHRSTVALAHARGVAQYLISVSLDYGSFATAEALGFNNVSIRRNVATIEDKRDDPKFDAYMDKLEEEIRTLIHE